jgi:hypothetical protein
LKRNTYIILIIIILAFAARVIYVQHGKKTILTSYPVQKIELSNNSVSIYIQKNAKLNDVVKLDFFKGISPDMTDSEVTNLLELPSNISEDMEVNLMSIILSSVELKWVILQGAYQMVNFMTKIYACSLEKILVKKISLSRL